MASEKRVTVALSVDSSFIRLLNASVQLDGGMDPDKEIDVRGVLARVFLAEARGAFKEEVHAIIPPQWRPNIEAVSDLRSVKEVSDGE